MGLFNGSAKKEEIENSIVQKMAQLPIVNELVECILEDVQKNPWVLKCQSYYDTCSRSVRIEPDGVVIIWKTQQELYELEDGKNVGIRVVEGDFGRSAWSFTKSGYMPLHSHCNEKGKIDVSLSRVCCLFGMLLQKQMAAKFQGCRFDPGVSEGACCAYFTYQVPKGTWQDWFQ